MDQIRTEQGRVTRAGYRAAVLVLVFALGSVIGMGKPRPVAPQNLVWPAPPEAPRIAFVQSITRPADAGVRLSGFKRFANWISGAEKGNEPLVKPFGICLDEKGNVCLTDTAARTVSFFDRKKLKWYRWDRLGKQLRFESPVAVAKQNNAIYVADSALGRVIVFDEQGRLLRQWSDHLSRPSGLTLAAGKLFVTDSQRHAVVIFDTTGRFESEFGSRGAAEGQFNFPTHISADHAGKLYVTDSMNSRIQVFDLQGRFQRQFGSAGDGLGHFSRPKGVAVDASGHIYVVDAMSDNLQIFNDAGKLLLNIGENGPAEGQFWLPNGIAISRDNEIFVADSYNRRLQVFHYIGQP